MNELINRLSLYDQLAYLFVGGIAMLASMLDILTFFPSNAIPEISLGNTIGWLLVAYFLGHIIQALSNFVVRERKSSFSGHERRLLDDIRDRLAFPDATESQAFHLAYVLAQSNDVSGQLKLFNIYYGLYRGWFVTGMLQSAIGATLIACREVSISSVIMEIFSILITALLFARMKRFSDYFRQMVFDTVLIHLKGEV